MKKVIIILSVVLIIILILLVVITSLLKKKDDSSKSPSPVFPTSPSGRSVIPNIQRTKNVSGILSTKSVPATGPNQSQVDKLQKLAPYQNDDLALYYSLELNKLIFEKKTVRADASLLRWTESNGLPSLYTFLLSKNTRELFLIRDLTQGSSSNPNAVGGTTGSNSTNSQNSNNSGSTNFNSSTGTSNTGSSSSGNSNSGTSNNGSPSTTGSNTESTSTSGQNTNTSTSSGSSITPALPYTNLAINALSASQKTNLEKIKDNLPDNTNFKVYYSEEFDTFIIQKKTATAQADIDKWAALNSISDVINNPNIFVSVDVPPEQYEDKIEEQLNITANPPAPQIAQQTYDILKSIMGGMPQMSPTQVPVPINTPAIVAETQTPTQVPTQNGTQNDIDILALISSYGLKPPIADGAEGYNALAAKVRASQNATWGVNEVLTAERKLGVKNRYLPSAWLWKEGAGTYADPYSANCDDYSDRLNRFSVTVYCTENPKDDDTTWTDQVSAFQLQDKVRANKMTTAYNAVKSTYQISDLRSLLQSVVDNSDKAALPEWNYKSQLGKGIVGTFLPNGQVPADVSESDIATDVSQVTSGGRKQFYTTLLGKYPAVTIYLNNDTLDQSFISMLKSGKCLYSSLPDTSKCYYNKDWKQHLSNVIAALYLIDTGKTTLAVSAPQSTPAKAGTNGYVLYLQTDPNYNPPIANVGSCGNQGAMTASGCGPTATAMIIATYKDKNYTPLDAKSEYARFSCDGTFIEDAYKVINAHGLKTSKILFSYEVAKPLSEVQNTLKGYIDEGWTIYALVPGHFIWITNIDDKGNIYAQDPYYGTRRTVQPPDKKFFHSAFAVKNE